VIWKRDLATLSAKAAGGIRSPECSLCERFFEPRRHSADLPASRRRAILGLYGTARTIVRERTAPKIEHQPLDGVEFVAWFDVTGPSTRLFVNFGCLFTAPSV
jgi:hypothetical protein